MHNSCTYYRPGTRAEFRPDSGAVFDVLAHVAYALAPLTRQDRAARAMAIISTHFNSKPQVFLDFVLSHYVSAGVEELDLAKLTPLLRLKYHDSIAMPGPILASRRRSARCFRASRSSSISRKRQWHEKDQSNPGYLRLG